MAFSLRAEALPLLAPSNIGPWIPVAPVASGPDRNVLPAATRNVEPIGIVKATALLGESVAVFDRGDVVELPIGASVGNGANVGVATTGGSLVVGPIAGTAGSVVYRLGRTLTSGAAGEYVSVYIDPLVLSGTP